MSEATQIFSREVAIDNLTAIEPLIAVELLKQYGSSLEETSRYLLEKVIRGDGKGLKLFSLKVDASRLNWLASSLEAKQLQEEALRYCVVRQASFPLLRRLFKVTRSQVKKIREETHALPPSPHKSCSINEAVRHEIYLEWVKLRKEYAKEIDCWFLLGQQYRSYPLNVLETIVMLDVHEGGSS